jgi:hypothetical protein
MTSIKLWIVFIYMPRVNCAVNQPQHACVGTEIERFVFVVFVVHLRRAIQYGSCASLSAYRLFGVKETAMKPEMAFPFNFTVLKREAVNSSKCYIVLFEFTHLPSFYPFSCYFISFSKLSRVFFTTTCRDLRLMRMGETASTCKV